MALVVVGRVALANATASAEAAPVAAVASADSARAPDRTGAAAADAPRDITPAVPDMPVPVPPAPATPAPEMMAPAVRAPTTAAAPDVQDAPAAAVGPLTAGRLVNPALTGGVAVTATERPGVPAITGALLPGARDSSRLLLVQPARRAAGNTRLVPAPVQRTPLTFDELRLRTGRVMRGRVDVVQAGSVIFRDQQSGLRYEIRKDDIDEIISEFGTPVRFRAAGAAATAGPSLRTAGVGGRYRLRYAAASAVGSPECVQVWTKPPNAEDVAFVQHRPGDDTLSVAFEGGDVFPSNIDADGWFASTFRIVPDQARTMTALTTRLNGRFRADGTVEFAVNLVFFRRMRGGADLTCNVTVKATGTRR